MKYLNVTNLVFLVLVIILSQNSVTFAQQNDLAVPRKSSFTYEAVIKNIPENTGTVYIWLPLPSSDDYQEITNLTVKSLFPHKETRENKYGNRILFIDASGCKVTELHIKASFDVKTKEHHANIEHAEINEKTSGLIADEVEMFLQPSRLAVIDDDIKSIATTIIREHENPLRKARAIYDYLIRKMEYNKEVPGWGRGDTKRAITVCKGNCSDFHSAFTSLAIAGGVPSRFEYGFVLPKSSQGSAIAHCWAEFYAKGFGWIPVDISEADKHPELKEYYFGNHDKNRILFSIGRDIQLNPAQNGKPLNFFINPYVEIDGKAHKDVQLFTTYERYLGPLIKPLSIY